MVIDSREMRGPTNYVCTVFRYFNGNRVEPNFTISVMRKGTGCAEGSTYNAQTGVCETPPENNCIKGLTDLFSSPPSNIFVSGGRNFVNSFAAHWLQEWMPVPADHLEDHQLLSLSR